MLRFSCLSKIIFNNTTDQKITGDDIGGNLQPNSYVQQGTHQEPVCFQMINGRPAAPMDFSGSNCLLISTLRHGAPKSHAARAGVMDRVSEEGRDVREIRGWHCTGPTGNRSLYVYRNIGKRFPTEEPHPHSIARAYSCAPGRHWRLDLCLCRLPLSYSGLS